MNEVRKVLLVEDDEIEVLKFERALKQLDIMIDFSISKNGEVALNFLKSNPINELLPELIILDLNMPIMDGFEFLEAIKNTRFESIPVVVLTTSNSQQDITRSKKFLIKDYVIKPVRYEDYLLKIENILKN